MVISDSQERWQYINTVFARSHNHIKITTKRQNNHHSEPPEIWLNVSPRTKRLKKKTHQDWQEGQRQRMGWLHTLMLWVKIGWDI